ncbi:Mediator of RNA polymerase II transcription subunit 7 [Trachymyrmex cornetzi]|uniref:Mediator of RNA polymerase II transcription subunit 7 n=1 Tax=Trachymyrmex cornetzi TaxID=471704 RepID=A0A195DQR3_9HYME|nr:Mediator of RNA polymerase II transcription subunit 7 [Trachymyrmex cornetzi]
MRRSKALTCLVWCLVCDYNQRRLGIVENELRDSGDETHEAQSRERPERPERTLPKAVLIALEHEFEFSGRRTCQNVWPDRSGYHPAIIPAFPASKQRVHVERTQSVKTETPLEAQGIKRLYPQHFDRRRELKKLNHSLLVNFLDLIDLLVQCPDSPRRAEKVEDLSLLFIHIHHLLNEFRPHQARETLRVMMELQRRQRHETALRFQKHLEKVQEILQHALQMLPDTSELDSKLAINTDAMESVDNLGFEQQTQDPCSSSDRIMCKVIDDMLSSNGLF